MWTAIVSASAAAALTVAIFRRFEAIAPHRFATVTTPPTRLEEPSGMTTAAGAPRPEAPLSTTTATAGDTSANGENGASASADLVDDHVQRELRHGRRRQRRRRLDVSSLRPRSWSRRRRRRRPSTRRATRAPRAAGTRSDDQTTREASAPDAGDAGAAQARDPWAPPSMSAGAGPFSTQAPYYGASAWVPNPNAGAGRFTTEAPPWAASAFESNPTAGAGAFTTEWNIPAYGVWPYWPWGPTGPSGTTGQPR